MGEVKKEGKKAFFLQRFIAFVIDMFLISLAASIITSPFINQDKTKKLEDEMLEILDGYQTESIKQEEFLSRYYNVYYKMSRETGITTLVTLLLSVGYFVVYQVSTKGQTLGKKIMKIRVVSGEGELTYNQMIFRSFLSNYILLDLLLFMFLLFSKRDLYFYVSGIFTMIQYAITFISALMVMSRKNGCAIHDRIAHTVVLREN